MNIFKIIGKKKNIAIVSFFKSNFKLTRNRIIALGFLSFIFLGSILLMLPISSKSGEWTPYLDSLFTSTSATCVTGLVVYDTYTQWSLFGQLVILSLIQIGGIGFMTIVTMLSIALKRHIGIQERLLIMQTAGSLKMTGLVSLIKRIIIATFTIELIGAIILSTRFIPDMGVLRGIYYSVFHSVSAFCNAGFDLLGYFSPFSSLTHYQGDIVVNITIMALVIIGGLGFFAWSDIIKVKFKFKKLQLHSKMVLLATAILLIAGFIGFFLFEFNHSLKDLSLSDKILASMFQSVSPRTAGFNTVDLSTLSDGGTTLTSILMFIGGSPGSTAGGIKTTTFLVLILEIIAIARGKSHVIIFKRKLDDTIIKQAGAIVTTYICAVCISCFIFFTFEKYDLSNTLFEVISAIGTVGLSTGITPDHTPATKIVLIVLMFLGRVGALTFILTLAQNKNVPPLDRPTDKIMVG